MDELENEIFLLQDDPLENDEKDGFGHDQIANTLVEVVKRAPKPFNIGLYGRWGVGKSTVCKILSNKLSKEKDYKVFYFDTWKYERDSFRRQFLIALDNDLNLQLNFKDRLNQSLTETDPTRGEIKFDSRLVFNKIGIIGLVLFGVGIFGWSLGIMTNWGSAYEITCSIITSLGLSVFFLQLTTNAISRVQVSLTKSKTDSAEGFEEHFAEVLNSILGKKLLIIIDNLDRLSSEKAVNLLSDVKTFLLKKNTVFIIPCDNKAINDQLHSQYGKDFDTEQYLRKFFNHSFQIPKFLNTDLDNFIVRKLNDTNIQELKDNFDVVFIVSYAFRNNPREIIQFINSLIPLYLLAKERKIDHIIDRKNIAFLAKILVLRVRWPILYERIENRVMRTGDSLLEILARIENDKNQELKALKDFVDITSQIEDDQYTDIYFSLRQSEQQKTIPEWDSFILSLIEGRGEDAEKLYKDIKASNRISQLSLLLSDYYRKHRDNEKILLNIFWVFTSIIPPEDVKYFESVSLLVFKHISIQSLSSYLEEIDFSKIFNDGLEGISSANKKLFSKKLVDIISHITQQDSISNKERIYSLKRLYEVVNSNENKDYFISKNNQLNESKKQFISHIKYQELLPANEESEYSKKAIVNDILKIVTELNPVSYRYFNEGLVLLTNLLHWPPVVDSDEIRLEILTKSLDFINKLSVPTSDANTLLVLSDFTQKVSIWYSNNKSPEERAVCVKIIQKINEVNPGNQSAHIVSNYIADSINTPDIIIKTIGKDFLINNENGRDSLIKRSRKSMDLLNNLPLKNKLSDKEKTDIFDHLFSNKEEAISFLEYINYKLPVQTEDNQNYLRDIVLRMINESNITDVKVFEKWLSAVNKLGIPTDQHSAFTDKLRQNRGISDDHKEIISKFVSSHSKYFAEAIVNEFK